jgi:hypothetical protein
MQAQKIKVQLDKQEKESNANAEAVDVTTPMGVLRGER